MSVESSAVQISINVVDQNSAAAIGQVTKNIESMGSAGAATGEKVAQGMGKITGHSLSALDNVRLLRDDIGVRIPRSMEKAIASSQLMMTAIKSIGTGLLAIGAIDIGVRIGKGLYDAYEKWISLNAAAQAYHQQVLKAQSEDFINVRNIETATERLYEATEAAKGFQDVARQTQRGSWTDIFAGLASGNFAQMGFGAGSLVGARKFADLGYQTQSQADALKGPQASFRHQQLLDEIELQHADDGRLRGQQKITAELEKQQAVNRENRRFEVEEEGLKGNKVPANAGQQHQEYLDQIAAQKAAADTFNLRREQGIELQHMQEAAREAGLRGQALLQAQESAAIEDLKNKDIDSVATRNAVHEKFHNEEMKRMQDQENEIRKMRDQTAAAGLTGTAKIQQEGRNRVSDILNDPNSTLNPGQRLAMVHEAVKQTQQAVAEEQQTFADHISALVDQTADRTITGFARIHADAQKEINQLVREASDKGAAPADLQRGEGAIRQGEADQVAELQRKNADETRQLESEARAKYLSAEKQQTVAIEEEYEQRLRKFQEELAQQEISQQDYDRRVVAAAQLRDAQMVESARQAREKMAGQFTSFFHSLDHPMQALKDVGDKVAGQAAAALVQRVQGRYVGTAGEHLGMPGGIFDRIAGVPRGTTGGEHLGLPTSSSSKMISLATAQIQIGSASIALGGAGAAASSGGGGLSGGSTSLFGGGGGAGFSSGGFSSGSSFGGGGGSFGGYGSTSGSTSAPASTAVSSSTAGAIGAGAGGVVSGALGDVQQGVGLVKQAGGIFGAKGSTSGIGKLFGFGGASGSGSKSLLGGGGMGAVGGAAGGAMGLFSAFEGSGGVGGALSGAMSGMQLGMSVGGPIGAAVGAAGGAIIGAIGFGGREQARVYDLKTVRPRIQQDILSYQQGGMDYTSAYSDLQSLDTEAKKTLEKMGSAGHSYYWDTVIGEIHQAEGKLSAEQRAGRSNYTVSAASYDVGTDAVPRDGMAMIHQGERIVPSDQNERITRAIESGADSSRMPAQSSAGWGGDIHVHAIDAKGVKQFLDDNKHGIRAAVNASYAENSGGADA